MKRETTARPRVKKETITYSMIREFQTCRTRYDYRYVKRIVPVETPVSLSFGSAIHEGLEQWFKLHSKEAAMFAVRCNTELETEDRLKAEELLSAYIDYWHDDPFEVLGVEQEFREPLVNPATKRSSHKWILCGKVDGIVRWHDGVYILEHKTASSINQAYIDRIMIDTQIAVYAEAIQRSLGVPVVGAIYDILEKPSIRMRQGETDEEFAARKAQLLARSKTGKTTAQKKEAETEEEFRDRLRQSIGQENFRREIVRFEDGAIERNATEVWNVASDIRTARVYKNTGACNTFGRPCPYLELCRCHGNLTACGGLYEIRDPHEELSKETTSMEEGNGD